LLKERSQFKIYRGKFRTEKGLLDSTLRRVDVAVKTKRLKGLRTGQQLGLWKWDNMLQTLQDEFLETAGSGDGDCQFRTWLMACKTEQHFGVNDNPWNGHKIKWRTMRLSDCEGVKEDEESRRNWNTGGYRGDTGQSWGVRQELRMLYISVCQTYFKWGPL
jgi:hypothetical protein